MLDSPFSTGLVWAVIIVALVFSVTGCPIAGTFVPTIESTPEVKDISPLKGAVGNIKTLAVLPTSVGRIMMSGTDLFKFTGGIYGVKFTVGSSEPSILKVTEQLQQNKRFQIVTPYQVEKALEKQAGQPMLPSQGPVSSMTASEKEEYRKQSISDAISQVKAKTQADAVVLIEAWQESGIGGVSAALGRNDTTLRLTMSVISAETGAVLWQQIATKSINAGGEFILDVVHPDLISAMVENFNQTFK